MVTVTDAGVVVLDDAAAAVDGAPGPVAPAGALVAGALVAGALVAGARVAAAEGSVEVVPAPRDAAWLASQPAPVGVGALESSAGLVVARAVVAGSGAVVAGGGAVLAGAVVAGDAAVVGVDSAALAAVCAPASFAWAIVTPGCPTVTAGGLAVLAI